MPITPKLEEARKATQFKPGQSGNPKGVPKGTKHLTTWIQELLEDDDFEADLIDSKKGLVEFKGAPIKAIIMAQRHKAVQGDQKAADLLMKYGWSSKSEVDLTSQGERVGAGVSDEQLEQLIQARTRRTDT